MMKFYVSRRGGIKGGSSSSISTSTSTSTPTRRFATLCLPTVLIILGIILPFLFIRTAFLALDSVSSCSSLDCVGWKLGPRVFGGSSSDLPLKLANELTRALIEANEKEEEKVDDEEEGTGIDGSRQGSFNDLVTDIISNSNSKGQSNNNNNNNMKAFVSKTKAMLLRMESRIKLARQQESMYKQLASYGVPKPMHCLSLRLAEEYSSNALARSPLPQPEFVYRLIDTSYHHFALLTDNILAASVVVSSTVINSAHPEKLVFHIVTDKQTYAPMHAWFALNPVALSVVEVKGLHQFDWPVEVNVKIKEMLEIHRSIYIHYKYFKKQKQGNDGFRLNCYSLVNQLRIFLPELFPELDKIVYLDDDIVVQNDLSPLWELDLNGKVNGAVVSSWAGKVKKERESDCPAGKLYGNYLNFSNPKVSEEFEYDRCAWLDGMNVFDLNAWRKTNITNTYHSWLKHNLNSAFTLWHPGVLPPSLIAFEGKVHPLDPSWHVAGLGDQKRPELRQEILEAAAVVHFSGPAKPWLEIGHAELCRLWYVHVNYSNEFIESCNIVKEY